MSKRKATAVRTPSGQLSRAGVRDYSPTQIRRITDQLARAATNPLAGYEIGRLHLAGHLTAEHVSAALRYADLASSWMRLHGVPSPNARAMDMGAVRGLSGADLTDDKARSIKDAWTAAQYALGTDALADWLYDVVIRDEAAVTVSQKRMVVVALDALARHWGDRRRTA
jgi:hypothetical protein